MAFELTINGQHYEMQSFSVQEASTPLAAGDSSGQVGTVNFSIPKPDPFITPDHTLIRYGTAQLLNKDVRLSDSRKGFTLGFITGIQEDQSSGLIQLSATSRLGRLNVYNVQSQPFAGSLLDAFTYYVSLAGITSDVLVDPDIAATPVVFPGWSGELWLHLKQMAAAIDCDISLVSGQILLRPIRVRTATRGRDIARSQAVGGGSLAQNVEVVQYNNRSITNELVYPPGGWTEDVVTYNVNSGQTIEQTLELSASVHSVNQPTMQTFVSAEHRSSSVFTVVGDDGLPIQPAQWAAQGGRLSLTINEDTRSLTLNVTAPTGIRNKDNKEIGVYGIALSSSASTGRYSTLRIVGSGVAFEKETVRVPTGITGQETSTEVGVTIDNPFLSTRDQVYTAGVRAAGSFNGSGLRVTGTVTAVNQRGNTGIEVLRSYAEFHAFAGGRTYATMQALFSGKSYKQVQDEFNAGSEDSFENQVFGNVSGARVWDEASKRWYRIRDTTLAPDTIQFSADDDLLHSDVQAFWQGESYSDIQMRYNGFSYGEVHLMGLRRERMTSTPGLFPGPDLFPDTTLFPVG